MVEALPFSRGPKDRPVLSVIIKGTFNIISNRPGEISSDQIPIAFGDEFFNEDDGSTKFESDIASFKPRADVVLVGKAYSPEGREVKSLDVSLRVGNLSKSIHITGDRHWIYGSLLLPITMSEPEPFKTMEIVYERSFGGMDMKNGDWCKENPVGEGFYAKKSKDTIDNAPLPNLEDPEDLIRFWDDRPKPVGFGFYGRMWMPRSSYLGTYDEKWRKERSPDPPEDFQFDYYNAAHPDLQVSGYLRGDEEVELINLTPEGWVRFRLPGIHPSVMVSKSDRLEDTTGEDNQTEEITLNLDTLCLIPEEKRFFQIWRGICNINDLSAIEVRKLIVEKRDSA